MERDQHLKLKDTPGGIITSTAFTYAIKFYDYAAVKLPELKQYPPDERGTLMQAGIIVATLILLERQAAGAGWKERHDNVSRSFPPSARHRCLTAVQDLAAALLKLNRTSIAPEAIPSFLGIAGEDDKRLSAAIGSWVALGVTKQRELVPADAAIASTMGRSLWTSAIMIARMAQKPR